MRKYDAEEVKENNVPKWQADLLKLNPEYNWWGNFEDYMSDKNGGWTDPTEIDSIDELWEQDELNVVANFYFEVEVPSKKCETCGEGGYNPETQKLTDDWYAFDNPNYVQNPYRENARYNKNAWCNDLTEVEVDALWKEGRLKHDFKEKPTPEQVNEWNLNGFGHDAINRHICVKARAENMGVYGLCPDCEGKGYVHTSPDSIISLQLWILHPRKGASRGLYLKDFKEEDVQFILEYLQEAGERNKNRFSKIMEAENATE